MIKKTGKPASLLEYDFPKWALNSAVECHPHTVEVVGSNPTAPTTAFPFSPAFAARTHFFPHTPNRRTSGSFQSGKNVQYKRLALTVYQCCGTRTRAKG